MDKILDDEKFHQVVVDLAELEFMNSTGLGVMIGRKNKLQTFYQNLASILQGIDSLKWEAWGHRANKRQNLELELNLTQG